MKLIRSVFTLSVPVLLAGCAQVGGAAELEKAIANSSGSQTSIKITDYVPTESTRFTVLCPYGTVEGIEEQLGFHSTEIPDYSLTESRNAIIASDGHDITAVLEIDASRIDLCPTTVAWHAMPVGHTLSFSEARDGVWVLEPDAFIGRKD